MRSFFMPQCSKTQSAKPIQKKQIKSQMAMSAGLCAGLSKKNQSRQIKKSPLVPFGVAPVRKTHFLQKHLPVKKAKSKCVSQKALALLRTHCRQMLSQIKQSGVFDNNSHTQPALSSVLTQNLPEQISKHLTLRGYRVRSSKQGLQMAQNALCQPKLWQAEE